MGWEQPVTYRAWLMVVESRLTEKDLAGRDNQGPRHDGAVPRRSILLVAPSWPHPPTWGFATRVFQLAKQLSRRHRVSLLAYGRGDVAAAQDDFGLIFESVHFVPPPPALQSKRRAQASSLLSSSSYHVGALRSVAIKAALEDVLARHSFDLVQIESSQMAFCAPVPGVPTALDEHNIEHLLLRRLADVESSPARKAFGYLEAAKVRVEEARAWANCDGSIFTSEADLAVFRAARPEKPASVVPNGVDVDYFRPSAEQPEPSTVVFTGSINYRPNTDAVAYFVRDVMPRLLRLRPSAKLVVVGQGAPDWLLRMSGSSVEFTGPVSDVRPYLDRASVVIAPLRVGSGTRLKILEGLSMQKAIVTTTIGCEGLGVVDGEHLRVADDPQQFAEHTALLMSDQKVASELARNGRALVERDYSWGVIVHRLEEFHSQLISKETRV